MLYFSRESTSYTLMIPRPMVSMMNSQHIIVGSDCSLRSESERAVVSAASRRIRRLHPRQLYIKRQTLSPSNPTLRVTSQRHYSPLQNNPIINHPTTIRQSNTHHFSKLMVSSTSHKIDRADYSVICTRPTSRPYILNVPPFGTS